MLFIHIHNHDSTVHSQPSETRACFNMTIKLIGRLVNVYVLYILRLRPIALTDPHATLFEGTQVYAVRLFFA